MEVLVDTSVWSEYFRKNHDLESDVLNNLKSLVSEGRAILAGTVKQELLSGIREELRFSKLKDLLAPFPTLLATDKDHILAATFFNRCRNREIQGSFVDFLLCAQAYNNHLSLLSTDKDFIHYGSILPIRLWGQ